MHSLRSTYSRIIRPVLSKDYHCRLFSSSSASDSSDDNKKDPKHPLRKTLNLLGNDIKRFKNLFSIKKEQEDEGPLEEYKRKPSDSGEFQSHCDVLIIGGGGIGSSIAYWLKKKARDGLNVVVLEKDSTYRKASTVLSVGMVRQQFTLPENIEMSLYAADFIRTVKEHLGDDVELNFSPHGMLMLATEEHAESLRQSSLLQNELGARNECLTAKQLKERFPWLNTDGFALGCIGLEKEGWFDPWSLLTGFRRRAQEYGAHFIDGEAINFEFRDQPEARVEGVEPGSYKSLDKVVVRLKTGEERTIKFALVVIAAGCFSGQVARLANIGTGPGILSVPLPVEPRKRYVYVFNSQGQNSPGIDTPLTVGKDHLYFRRDGLGGNFLCGKSPSNEKEPNCDNLDVDYDYFNNEIWPELASLVPAFESLKLRNAWGGYYDHNYYDGNGIIGPHPYYYNMYLATGFSGNGIQKVPAVGRAISELIIDGQYRTIDLSRFAFDRLIVDQPLYEGGTV